MPKKEIINVEMKGGNPNLSPGARFGDLVFVAGQTGTHPDTGKLGRGCGRADSLHHRAHQKGCWRRRGTNLDNVLSVNCWLTKRGDLAEFNEEYGKHFTVSKPPRATVEVMLNRPDLLVEIMVTACIPS